MRYMLVVAITTILSGCLSSGTGRLPHKLGVEWEPLTEIRERPALVANLGSPTAITTVGDAAYVRDLEEWLGRVPPNTAKFSAIMRHEQEHSRRQIDYGTSLWVARYAVDKDFALREEKIGYYYEITEKRRFGLVVDPNIYAAVLSNYEILTGKLIGFNEAFLWVNDVIEGRWTPED